MPHIKFKIEEIDQINKSFVVRFINPYGDISTGKKKIEDFTELQRYPSGNFDSDGNEIMEEISVITRGNPNDDLVLNYSIPINKDSNTLFDKDSIIDFISEQIPNDYFEDYKIKNENIIDENFINILNEDIEFEIKSLPISSNENEDVRIPNQIEVEIL